MMKFFNLALFLFFSIPIISQTNKSKITIEITYIKAYKNHRDTTDTAPKILRNLEYQFLCNTNEAHFEYIPSMDNDRVSNKQFIGKGGGKGVYYKNLTEDINLRKIEKDEQIFYVNNHKLKWKLHKDQSKKILGYNCFKATTSVTEKSFLKKGNYTYKVTSWYAPALPIPFGPAGNDGLPGLVLESYRGSFFLTANDIKFHKKQKLIPKLKPKKTINYEEYNRIQYKNLMRILKQN